MKRLVLIVCVAVFIVVIGLVGCNTGAQNTKKSGIRGVDFLNFTYGSTFCSAEYGNDGIGKLVTLRNGEFRTPQEMVMKTTTSILELLIIRLCMETLQMMVKRKPLCMSDAEHQSQISV
jgi:hypothetical protein